MKEREEIQIFSLSFLDLLCCSMSGVVLLWVLTSTPLGNSAQRSFAYCEITQRGRNHLKCVTLVATGGATTEWTLDSDTIEELVDAAAEHGVKIIPPEESPGDFAVRVALMVDRRTKPCVVRLEFKTCRAPEDIHTITVREITGQGAKEERFVLQYEEDLKTSFAATTVLDTYKKNSRFIASTTFEGTLTLKIQLGPGKAHLDPTPELSPDTKNYP